MKSWHLSLQRKEKLQDHVSKLGEEVADVLITTLLLAERMGVDVEEALALKIEDSSTVSTAMTALKDLKNCLRRKQNPKRQKFCSSF